MLSETKQILKIFWNSDLRTIVKILFFPFLFSLVGFGEIVVKIVAKILCLLEFVLFKRNKNV